MSSAEARPSDVMDSNYWRPAEATAKLTTFGENFRLQRRGKIDAASFAQKVTEANANGWRKADRSLEYGELVDFSTLAIGSLVRFDREYLIGARHTSYRGSAALVGEHIVAEGGFAGLSYDRTPFNEPQDGQHWTYLYERQVGFAGVWRAPARRKVIFGVKKRVKKITTGFETDNFGKPKNLDFIETFEPVILKMPITKGAKIGIANQYHKTTTDKDGSAGELYIVERFNSLDIFEEP